MKYSAVPLVFGIFMASTSAIKSVDRGSPAAVVKIDFDRQIAPSVVNGISMNRQTAPAIETWDNQVSILGGTRWLNLLAMTDSKAANILHSKSQRGHTASKRPSRARYWKR